VVRVTIAPARKKRKKRLFKRAKGFTGDRKNHIRLTKDAVMKAMAFNYIHRKKHKNNIRRLWIVRISVAAKLNGISYSRLINGLTKAECKVDRKMLSDLAMNNPKAFETIANTAKSALKT